MSTIAIEWGQRLKERREALGLTPQDVAAAVEKHVSMVYRYEAGEVTPAPHVQIQLARILDMPPRDLFPLEDVAS